MRKEMINNVYGSTDYREIDQTDLIVKHFNYNIYKDMFIMLNQQQFCRVTVRTSLLKHKKKNLKEYYRFNTTLTLPLALLKRQTVKTQNRRRILWCLICVYTVYCIVDCNRDLSESDM